MHTFCMHLIFIYMAHNRPDLPHAFVMHWHCRHCVNVHWISCSSHDYQYENNAVLQNHAMDCVNTYLRGDQSKPDYLWKKVLLDPITHWSCWVCLRLVNNCLIWYLTELLFDFAFPEVCLICVSWGQREKVNSIHDWQGARPLPILW